MLDFFKRKPKFKTINLGKVDIHFHYYNGEVFKKTIYGQHFPMFEFSYHVTAKNLAEELRKEYVKANKIAIADHYLVDTREIQKIIIDPQERYEIEIEV